MLTCSFCGLEAKSVDALLAGPEVNICDRCIGVGVRTLATRDALEQPDPTPSEWESTEDHSMFIQAGCPAIAVTSNWLLENMATQSITHTRSDRIDRVDPDRVVSCALSLKRFIEVLS